MKKFFKVTGITILALIVLIVVVLFVPVKKGLNGYTNDEIIDYNNREYYNLEPCPDFNTPHYYSIKDLGFININKKLKNFELMYNFNYKDFKEIYTRYTLFDLMLQIPPEGYEMNEDYIFTTYSYGGNIYKLNISVNAQMPEFTADNIEGVYKYKWVTDLKSDYKEYSSFNRIHLYDESYGENTDYYEFKPDENAIAHTDFEYISDFVKTFNETNSINELSQKLDKDENDENIYYVVEFKDKSFPFCLVMSDEYNR